MLGHEMGGEIKRAKFLGEKVFVSLHGGQKKLRGGRLSGSIEHSNSSHKSDMEIVGIGRDMCFHLTRPVYHFPSIVLFFNQRHELQKYRFLNVFSFFSVNDNE